MMLSRISVNFIVFLVIISTFVSARGYRLLRVTTRSKSWLTSFDRSPNSNRFSKLELSRSISLDNPVLHGPSAVGSKIGFVLTAVAVISVNFLMRHASDVTKFISVLHNFTGGDARVSPNGIETMSGLPAIITVLQRRLGSIITYLQSRFRSTVDVARSFILRSLRFNRTEKMAIDDWGVCSLECREQLSGGKYVKYRFSFENTRASLPLYVGQELLMCSTDTKGRVIKEGFFPVSPPNFRGGFEILAKQSDVINSWRLSDSYSSFVSSLDVLENGDELAFKGGSLRLNYTGKDDPIKYVTVVTSGSGIAPALQILNGILTDDDSSVEDMELLWANTDKRDFICDNDIESLESRFSDKLFVTRVFEPKLLSTDLKFSGMDNILGALSAYEPNRIAILCGSDEVISKFHSFLLDVGYPQESILSVAVE